MSRSIWKGYFLNKSIFKLIKKKSVWNRSLTIPNFLINQTVFVHNGKSFKKLFITREKVGYKFGEFSFTRKHSKRIKPVKKKIK